MRNNFFSGDASMMSRILCASLIAVMTFACSKSDSESIASDEIYANFTIVGKGSSVECSASLYVGGIPGTMLELSGQDALLCGLGDVTTRFKGNSGSYSATGLPFEEGKSYQVVFARGKGQCVDNDEQHVSAAVLPAAITIASPASGSTHNKSSDLTLTWTAATSTNVMISLVGEKLNEAQEKVTATYSETSPDDGSFTIAKANFSNWINASGMKITLTRINSGSHSSSLKGGSTKAIQTHSVDINLSGSLASGAAEMSLPSPRPMALSKSKELSRDVKDLSGMRVNEKLCGRSP